MSHIDRYSEGRLWLQGYNRPSMFWLDATIYKPLRV